MQFSFFYKIFVLVKINKSILRKAIFHKLPEGMDFPDQIIVNIKLKSCMK